MDDALSSDALTADFRLLQRKRGHRFSLDDLVTAWVATRACPDAQVALDLGCGVGSVLLMVAWRLPEARLFGIEAQAISAALCRRNIAENGVDHRVTLAEGDLRALCQREAYPPCDLVTGTPPYLPQGTALLSPDPQRAAARIELRGGVEDYLAAAARVLAPGGRAVVCADGRFPERVLRGARSAGLVALARLDVMPRAGVRDPLLAVWTCAREGEAVTETQLSHTRLFMRDAQGERTDEARALRRHFGLEDGGLKA